jgi:dihydroneopterin aldolase
MEIKIKLNTIELFGYHGILDDEKINGQRFEIDVELTFKLMSAIKLDNIKNTIDYSKVCERIIEIFHEKRVNLIETLADSIGNALMSEYNLLFCKIYIRKPDVMMSCKIESVGIEANFIK